MQGSRAAYRRLSARISRACRAILVSFGPQILDERASRAPARRRAKAKTRTIPPIIQPISPMQSMVFIIIGLSPRNREKNSARVAGLSRTMVDMNLSDAAERERALLRSGRAEGSWQRQAVRQCSGIAMIELSGEPQALRDALRQFVGALARLCACEGPGALAKQAHPSDEQLAPQVRQRHMNGQRRPWIPSPCRVARMTRSRPSSRDGRPSR